MTKKQEPEWLLPSAQQHTVQFSLANVLSTATVETRDGEYMLEAAGKKALRIALDHELAREVMGRAAELKAQEARIFGRECAVLDQIEIAAQDSASGKYQTQFNHMLKDRLADQLIQTDDIVVGKMQGELRRSLPEVKPPRPLSVVEKVFGAGKDR